MCKPDCTPADRELNRCGLHFIVLFCVQESTCIARTRCLLANPGITCWPILGSHVGQSLGSLVCVIVDFGVAGGDRHHKVDTPPEPRGAGPAAEAADVQP